MQPVLRLDGTWRAKVADDDIRRDGVGLDHPDTDWPTLEVPGHWRTANDFAENDQPVLHRTRFTLTPPSPGTRRFVTLDGVFYQADVWLDGAYLGDPEGYFFPHTFDITDLSRLADDHVLAVEVACSADRHRTAKRNITGSLQHSDTIDPSWNPGGLWRSVHIDDTGAVRIDRLRALCRDANETRAHLRLHARLDSDRSRQVVVRTLVADVVVNETARSLAGGLNEVDWTVDIDRPRLWWPWSLGEQHLTQIEVQILVDGEQSDNRHVRTGLREIAMADFVLTVNGEPLFVKGVNLLPTRAALADATPEEVRRDIALARDAGLDLVRVNGHIARPELYDAADELGMLVWQDFPLQWNYARTVRRQAVRQAREAVDMLGHHPSIAVWCAHNDPAPVAARRLNTPSIVRNLLQQQVPSWNRTILDQWVKRAFESADETRPTMAHSGISDSHLYFGWYHGDERDLSGFAATVPRLVRFVGEFGTQSVPNTDNFIEPTKWPSLDWEHLAEHHGLDLEVFNERFPVAGYTSYTAWRDATQRYQADVLRHHIETLRRLKYRPTGGFCFLALADPSPAIGWSILDHERHPKAAWSAVVEACRPVIVVADRLPAEVAPGTALALDIHVVSDLRHPLEAVRCTAYMRWPGGGHQWQWQGDIGADTCVRVGTCQMVVPEAPGELWLDLTLEHDHLVASNRYTCRITA